MIRRWTIAFGLAAVMGVGTVGCGGSSPTDESFDDFANVDGDVVLNVGVLVDNPTAGPGDIVELSATVDAVRAEAVAKGFWPPRGRKETLQGQMNKIVLAAPFSPVT